MSLYNIGLFIKSRREEMGISQEELCEGICSVSTLSRIENERSAPTQKHVLALLQRLGYSDVPVFIARDSESLEIANLQNIIVSDISLKKNAEAQEHLKELKKYCKLFDASDRLHFELMNEILRVRSGVDNPEQAVIKFEEIIKITHPGYRRDSLPKVMTHDEIMTINNIAIHLSLAKRNDDALQIFLGLIEYYKSKISDPELSKKFLPTVYYNASKILGMTQEYDKCIRLCDEGMEYCVNVRRFAEMPHLLYNKAWCLVRRNLPGDMEIARKIVKEAYVVDKVFGKKGTLSLNISNLLKDYFDEKPPEF